MTKTEEYRANAAECDRMARTTRNESERRTWQKMAASWSRMTEWKSDAKADDPSGLRRPSLWAS
jgi:hypothetical protein